MQYQFRKFLTRLSLLLLLYTVTGCHSNTEQVSTIHDNYKFDQQVIEKLPVYDSLVAAIMVKFSLFQGYVNENDGYKAFRYMPESIESEVFKKLPPEIGAEIDPYFTTLGQNFIYGFDIFKDSTIKIYIRTSRSEKKEIDIEESLSYYPAGKNIRQRESPIKDTILNKYWQYWTMFNKRSFF